MESAALDNFTAANEVYTVITKDYPEDYRGWWGLIICKTRNFSELFLDQSELNVWLSYVKQLADSQTFSELQRVYIEYTQKVSVPAAEKDMEEVRADIKDYKSRIGQIESDIGDIQKDIENKRRQCQSKSADFDERIKKCEKTISGVRVEVFFCIIGTLALVGGVDLISMGSILLGIFLGFCGLFLVIAMLKLLLEVDGEKSELSRTKCDKIECEANYEKDIDGYNLQIEKHKKAIGKVQAMIDSCQKYLNLGVDKIATYWFAEKCSEFGVVQDCDNQIREAREAVVNLRLKNRKI